MRVINNNNNDNDIKEDDDKKNMRCFSHSGENNKIDRVIWLDWNRIVGWVRVCSIEF